MATRSNEITTSVEEVTPEIAASWLESMGTNRKLSNFTVERYADAMKTDRWQQDGSPIRFNTKGELTDGQHRLWAIIESATTQKLLIARNVPNDAFLVMDSGKKRGFADVLTIEYPDVQDVLSVAAVTRSIYRVDLGQPVATVVIGSGKDVANLDLLNFFREKRDDIVAAQKVGRRAYGRFHAIPLRHWGMLVYLFQEVDLEDANDFMHKVAEGKGLSDDSPIHLLRRILAESALGKKRTALELVALTIKAWNLYRSGQTVQTLLIKLGGANPEPFPNIK